MTVWTYFTEKHLIALWLSKSTMVDRLVGDWGWTASLGLPWRLMTKNQLAFNGCLLIVELCCKLFSCQVTSSACVVVGLCLVNFYFLFFCELILFLNSWLKIDLKQGCEMTRRQLVPVADKWIWCRNRLVSSRGVGEGVTLWKGLELGEGGRGLMNDSFQAAISP